MSSPARNALDNPEYFDRADGVRHPGDPLARDGEIPSVNIDGLKNEKRRPQIPTPGMGDPVLGLGPEHDYYNEFDQASRTSRPHPGMYIDPRTESTV